MTSCDMDGHVTSSTTGIAAGNSISGLNFSNNLQAAFTLAFFQFWNSPIGDNFNFLRCRAYEL